MSNASLYTTVFFDLDDTLYPRSSGLQSVISMRKQRFFVERMGVPEHEVRSLRKRMRETYGSALSGLRQEGYPVNTDDFLSYVHDISLATITPNPVLRAGLLALPLRRAILTNSSVEHASRVLNHLHIAECFERVIDIRALEYLGKPAAGAYQIALNIMGTRAPCAILVEDSAQNTGAARVMGMTTILVDNPQTEHADYVAHDINDAVGVVRRLAAG